jgi:hypothetical protein
MMLSKPESCVVGGKALRAQINVWQGGHAHSVRTVCGLDTMLDVNLALVELLHDVHEIAADNVSGLKGVLKVLHEGKVICVPALVAIASQLPRLCDVSLGIPGLDRLRVCVDQHRAKQRQPLICHVGEKTLRVWWESNAGQAAPSINHDIDQVYPRSSSSTTPLKEVRERV